MKWKLLYCILGFILGIMEATISYYSKARLNICGDFWVPC